MESIEIKDKHHVELVYESNVIDHSNSTFVVKAWTLDYGSYLEVLMINEDCPDNSFNQLRKSDHSDGIQKVPGWVYTSVIVPDNELTRTLLDYLSLPQSMLKTKSRDYYFRSQLVIMLMDLWD